MPKSIFSATPGFAFIGTAFVLLGAFGSINQIHVLLAAVILAAILLTADLFMNKLNVYLISIWVLAFTYLYLSEWLSLRSSVYSYFIRDHVTTAEGFITAAFGFSIIGYGIIASILRNKTAESSDDSLVFTKTNIPGAYLLFIMLQGLFIWWFVFAAIGTENLLYNARIDRSTTIELNSVVRQVATAATILFPVLAYYTYIRFRINFFIILLLAGGTLSALLYIVSNGTRYFLGYAAAGILFYITKGFRSQSMRNALLVLFCLVAMLFTQRFVRTMRAEGLGNITIKSVFDIADNASSLLSAENLLFYNVLAVENQYYKTDRPLENLFVTYWWVPRSLWANKPTQYGHWMPREEGIVSISSTHSVAGGFSMPALIDFGPVLGAVFCLVYGGFIATLEKYVAVASKRDDLSTVLASTIYFSVFFMMRSLHLSIINISLFALLLLLPNALLKAYRRHLERAKMSDLRLPQNNLRPNMNGGRSSPMALTDRVKHGGKRLAVHFTDE